MRPRVEKLWVRDDKTRLVESVRWQIEKVSEAVPEVPVRGALCFNDAHWGLLAEPFTVNGVLVTWPKNLAKCLAADTGGEADVEAVAAQLARQFRSR